MKPKKWMILSATVLVLFLAFLYLPIPGLESAGHRSLRWQADGDAAEIAGECEESHFRRLLAKSNLKRPFPDMPIRKDNLTTQEKIELGRLLFFDPVLSDDNEISCAHCHHPDLGLSDNRGRAMGNSADGVGPERTGGVLLRRGAPTLWNAAYNQRQFWDGRARDLEDQAGNPITDPNEMAQDTTQLVDELRGIPEYSRMFEKAFGARKGPAVTFQNVVYALAAFERTLLSTRSKFDRYANGEVSALSPIERRGLNVFRSLKTRCFECHNVPTFANPDFKVIGVPDLLDSEPDLGRGEIAGERYNRAFKVPTLRNVALTAPYMHNGIFETLDEVIDFYAGGGGPGKALNVSNLDDKIRKFSLTAEEKSSLIAFLHALTDESNKPEIPESVPSGLPVVPKLENQSPKLAAFKAEPAASRSLHIARARKRIIVMEGQLIQDGIDVAAPGDTIFVMPGTYHETLTVDVSGITLWGAGIKGERPVLDGQNRLSDGLIGSGSDFEMGNFIVKNYTANGEMMNGSVKVTFRHLFCENTGLYGIYPVECVNVLVEECSVTGAKDA
ncbi:MAG: cytochrome c peroxidase, partial [Nitrospinales bacterium]